MQLSAIGDLLLAKGGTEEIKAMAGSWSGQRQLKAES
jgi:hypothetical protein